MTVVENVLIGGVEASFYTVLHYLAGSRWTLQLLNLHRDRKNSSSTVNKPNQERTSHLFGTTQESANLFSATCDVSDLKTSATPLSLFGFLSRYKLGVITFMSLQDHLERKRDFVM